MHPGMIGGIVGVVIGLFGGLVGTYFSIHNTNGPRERSFMIRVSAICWLLLLVFLALLILLPMPFNFLLWAPYGILMGFGIPYGNRIQQRIRREEKAELSERPAEDDREAIQSDS